MFKRNDWIFGLVAILVGVVTLNGIRELASVRSMDPAGPTVLPRILAWGMIGIGAVHVIAALLLRLKSSCSGDCARFSLRIFRPVALIVACSAAFIAALPYLGYPLSMPLLIASVMVIVGERSVPRIVKTAILTTVLLFAIFYWGLNVSLPLGFLEELM